MTFNQHFASYNAGETAAFTADEAARLADLGVTGDPPPPEGGAAPVNTAVPAVTQLADTLSCSTGTWDGAPTTYAYAWKLDGADVGTDSASHTVTAADAGKSATCIVTATNATGSTAAPASTGVVVTDPGGRMSDVVPGTLVHMRTLRRFAHYSRASLSPFRSMPRATSTRRRLAQPLQLFVPVAPGAAEEPAAPVRQPTGIVRK